MTGLSPAVNLVNPFKIYPFKFPINMTRNIKVLNNKMFQTKIICK